jgi:hypothetical protein
MKPECINCSVLLFNTKPYCKDCSSDNEVNKTELDTYLRTAAAQGRIRSGDLTLAIALRSKLNNV